MENKTQIKVRSRLNKAIETVKEHLSVVKEVKSTQYKTHCEFKWAPTSPHVSHRIRVESNIVTLISIHSSLRTKKRDYEESAKQIGLTEYPIYTWQEIDVNHWLHDIELRIAVVNSSKTKKDLEEKLKFLESNLSKEERLEKELRNMGY